LLWSNFNQLWETNVWRCTRQMKRFEQYAYGHNILDYADQLLRILLAFTESLNRRLVLKLNTNLASPPENGTKPAVLSQRLKSSWLPLLREKFGFPFAIKFSHCACTCLLEELGCTALHGFQNHLLTP
jgi:hypothetical protein